MEKEQTMMAKCEKKRLTYHVLRLADEGHKCMRIYHFHAAEDEPETTHSVLQYCGKKQCSGPCNIDREFAEKIFKNEVKRE